MHFGSIATKTIVGWQMLGARLLALFRCMRHGAAIARVNAPAAMFVGIAGTACAAVAFVLEHSADNNLEARHR